MVNLFVIYEIDACSVFDISKDCSNELVLNFSETSTNVSNYHRKELKKLRFIKTIIFISQI